MNSQQVMVQIKEPKGLGESYVIDTYAWVEYFRNSPLSGRVENILETGKCFTPTIVIAELQTKFLRDGLDFAKAFNFIETRKIS